MPEDDRESIAEVGSTNGSQHSNSRLVAEYPEVYASAKEAGLQAAIRLGLRRQMQGPNSSEDEENVELGNKRPRPGSDNN